MHRRLWNMDHASFFSEATLIIEIGVYKGVCVWQIDIFLRDSKEQLYNSLMMIEAFSHVFQALLLCLIWQDVMSVHLILLTSLWEFSFCWHLIVHIMEKRTFKFVLLWFTQLKIHWIHKEIIIFPNYNSWLITDCYGHSDYLMTDLWDLSQYHHLENDCQALLYYLKFGKYMVYFLFKSGFDNTSKDTAIVIIIMLVHKQFLRVQRNSVLQFDLFEQAVACNY